MTTSETAYWSIVEAIEQAESKREANSGSLTPQLQERIVLQDVNLSFDSISVLNHLSMELPHRQLTFLVGASGSGKSSVADLILGFVEPDSGVVLIDDAPLAQLDLDQWRRNIGYVSQDNVLLNDTVFNNVAVGLPNASNEAVETALRSADALEFVMQLEGGLQAQVGERGGRLSGGQRQRILIARAIVHKPTLLILDEATSALDEATEQQISRTLTKLKSDITIFAISHRTSSLHCADRVYQLSDGQASQAMTPRLISDST